MADSISIVMKMNEDITGKMKSIASMSQGCSKEMEDLGRKTQQLGERYEKLNKYAAEAATQAAGVKKAMNAAAETFKRTGDEADRVTFQNLKEQYNELTESAGAFQKQARSTMKEATDSYEKFRKMDLGLSDSGGIGASGAIPGQGDLLGKLGQAGFFKMAGDAVSQLAGVALESAIGQPLASLASSAASGMASGAAAGMMIGHPVLGAAIGGGIGAVSGLTQMGQQRDEAFKGYVQENAENQLNQQDADIQSGSAVAAQREQDAIAFDTMLGEGIGTDYLKDLRSMAAKTPMEYGDLTAMSRSLATGFKDDPSRMLGLMTSIGNAGSAVGADAGGMNTMATAMARMQSSGKTSLEYVNLIQERGVDAIGMLADGLGKTKAQIYDMISKGQIDGVDAVNIIQSAMDTMYGGAMEKQSQTFSGLSSTLADAQTEMQAAYGEGYNEERGIGIAAETDYLSGISGERQQEANRAIGAWQASLENAKDEAIRKAVDGAMESDEYRAAQAEGDAAKMGEIIARAKVQGQNEYNASEGAQLALESERSLAEAIRDDAATNHDYWAAGYEKGNWYSIGLAAAIGDGQFYDSMLDDPTGQSGFTRNDKGSDAFGLRRVPETGLYLLHQDETVKTAAESRAGGGTGGVKVEITGPVTVRKDSDLDEIAQRLFREIQLAELRSS